MSSSQINLENADLEKLNDKDKTDLRQFLANEQQRSQIQARTSTNPHPMPKLAPPSLCRVRTYIFSAVANEVPEQKPTALPRSAGPSALPAASRTTSLTGVRRAALPTASTDFST
ncbi:import inner membrane translocase subunit TIM8 [Ilyonectria robusta]